MSSELEVLKQRITELEAENAELRKENTEIRDLRFKLSMSDAEIAELKHRNAETLRSNAEYNERRDAENAKLRARIEEMESEFGDRITKVEQKQTLNEPRGASHNSSNNNSSNFNLVADQVPTVTHHEKPLVDTSLPEDKETDAFLDGEYKKKVSDEIRQRKREKKLQGELIPQESSPAINTNCITDLSMTSTELVTLQEQVAEESIPKESSAESAMSCELKLSSGNRQDTPPKKIPYNQKVEQDLICELLEFIRCHNSTPLLNSISSKHIPDVQVDADLTPGSILHLAHLFDKAEKTGRKEKLRWYYYSEEYEKKVITLSSENNISKQMARTQIYDEIELYLAGKTREY